MVSFHWWSFHTKIYIFFITLYTWNPIRVRNYELLCYQRVTINGQERYSVTVNLWLNVHGLKRHKTFCQFILVLRLMIFLPKEKKINRKQNKCGSYTAHAGTSKYNTCETSKKKRKMKNPFDKKNLCWMKWNEILQFVC